MFSPFSDSKLISFTILRIREALRFKTEPNITLSIPSYPTHALAMIHIYTNCTTSYPERISFKFLFPLQTSTISFRYAKMYSTQECRQIIVPSIASKPVKQLVTQIEAEYLSDHKLSLI